MEPRDTVRSSRARIEAVVRGRVQGVGYRAFVLDEASQLGLSGWVANEPDGSVRIQAEGRGDDLEQLLARLWDGPRAAWVDDVVVTPMTVSGRDDGFRVRTGWHLGD